MQRCHQMESKHPCCNRCLAGAVSTTRSEIAIQRKAKGFGYTNCISLGSRLIKTIKCSQLFEINFERVWIKKVGNKKKKKQRERSMIFFFIFIFWFFFFFSSLLSMRKEQEKKEADSPPGPFTSQRRAQPAGAELCFNAVLWVQSRARAMLALCWGPAGLGGAVWAPQGVPLVFLLSPSLSVLMVPAEGR